MGLMSMRVRPWHLAALAAVFVGACQSEAAEGPRPSEGASSAVAPGPSLMERASSESIPASFALGRPATDADIAPLDIHVMPDGRGLPDGSGTAAEGEALYATKCAACHGVNGEGTPLGTAVIASDAEEGFRRRVMGHYWPHATTAFDYIRRGMPWDAPGTLTADEVYSVVAFLLASSGVIERDVVLDADALRAIEMPARDRFVVDNRLETNTVR